MVKKTVSIIIPNYNGSQLLSKNLPAVIKAAENYDKKTQIIVVDDKSDDDSLEVLKKFPRVLAITKKRNEGFSSTCNIGAQKANGEIIVLLNSDVAPRVDFLDYLLPHFDNEKVFAVGCLDKSLERGKEIDRGRGIGWFKNGFLIHQRGEVNKTNTLWASGGSSAFNKKIWQELKGFDENFNPFYWEDIDLSYRAQKRGYQVLFEPKAIVIHTHEEGAIKSKYSNSQIKTIAYRNQFLFFWKNITDGDLILQHLFYLPWYLIKSLLRGDLPFFVGLWGAIKKLPVVYNYRATVCGSITRDKEIVSAFINEN